MPPRSRNSLKKTASPPIPSSQPSSVKARSDGPPPPPSWRVWRRRLRRSVSGTCSFPKTTSLRVLDSQTWNMDWWPSCSARARLPRRYGLLYSSSGAVIYSLERSCKLIFLIANHHFFLSPGYQQCRPRYRQHGGVRQVRQWRTKEAMACALTGGKDPLCFPHDRARCRI